MAMNYSTAAELHGVTKRYGDVCALRAIDLAIERGKITALLGPNGAGKTTAVRILLGLVSPNSGTATVFGADPRLTSTRARIGAMLQVSKVPETLRVREHIEVFRSYYPTPMPYPAVIAAAGLDGLDKRLFGTLSGGQRQRVLFALALCGNPDLLMLDEPTVGLDVESRRGLWDAIRRLADEGRAVLLTTHYLDEADALAHRVVVIARGEIVAEGTPSEIKSRVVRRRVRCVTALSLDEVRMIAAGASLRRDGAVTEVLTTKAEDLVRALLVRDPTLAGLDVTGGGLEDAFLALTREESDAVAVSSVEYAVTKAVA
ncbi:MAG: ABC transporter ATP-binding protein [Anaerolineae bacterium]|nr:ABC transporter ATP-binding protein [Gemmatimonadaceae bacterium]